MAKKVQKVTKEYLEQKLKSLTEGQQKVEKQINDYMELYQRLDGAIEVTKDLIAEFEDEEVEPITTDK